MKIKNIKINNYGNLENKNINLENKINVIYGKNESGKSTLLNYIKNIFYGISKNKNGREISDYEKYKPWLKEEFSGKLIYELDNEEKFEIFRDFNKKNPKVFNEKMEDISKKFQIVKKDGVQFFYEQTNVDEDMFLSTVVSMQQEVRLDKQSQANLVQKLANLAGTGDDNMSFKKAMDRLSKKQLEEVGSDRSQGKPINLVKNRLQELTFVIKDMNSYKNRKNEIETEKEKSAEKISQLEIQKIITEKINELKTEKNNLIKNKEKIIQKINEKNKKTEKNNKTNNKNKLKNNKLIYFILFVILFIISIIIKIINTKFIQNNILNIFTYFIVPIYVAILLIKYIYEKNKIKKEKYYKKINDAVEEEKNKNEIYLIENQIKNINNEIENLISEEKNQEDEINQIQQKIDTDVKNELQKIKCQYTDKIQVEEFLKHFDISQAGEELKKIQKDLENNKIIFNRIQVEEKNIDLQLDNLISLQEEYKKLEEELQELENKNANIEAAKKYLNLAYEKMKDTVTPKFAKNLSETIAEISNGKYKKVAVHDAGLMVENEYGEYIPVDRLSVGTIDQLYLSLRLSMIDELSKEKMPIILDEAFAYYDEDRLENILQYLVTQLGNHQLIIFTCTKREQNILDKLGIAYNLVELS